MGTHKRIRKLPESDDPMLAVVKPPVSSKAQAVAARKKREATLQAMGDVSIASKATNFKLKRWRERGCGSWPISPPDERTKITKCEPAYAWGALKWTKPQRMQMETG